MFKKLAKIKYLPNNFEVIQDGDYVICAISGKKINLEKKIRRRSLLLGISKSIFESKNKTS